MALPIAGLTAIDHLNRLIGSEDVKVVATFGAVDDVIYGLTLKLKDGKTITIVANVTRTDLQGQRPGWAISSVLEVDVSS